jgi:hypothetical protein
MEVPDQLVADIHNYLITRPYGEVEGICLELRVVMAQRKRQMKDGKTAEKIKKNSNGNEQKKAGGKS